MLKKETTQIQHELADHCLGKETQNIPGVVEKRLVHYKRLIYNIIEDAIESAYPITRSILSDDQWGELIETFITKHHCQHPQLFRMPEELIDFVVEQGFQLKFNMPFLVDILQFEWAEVEIHTMRDEVITKKAVSSDLLNTPVQFSPYCQLLTLEYPVHKLKILELNQHKGEYYYLVYREESGTVQYLELTALTHYLIQQLSIGRTTLKSALDIVVSEEENQNQLYEQGISFLKNLRSLNVLLS